MVDKAGGTGVLGLQIQHLGVAVVLNSTLGILPNIEKIVHQRDIFDVKLAYYPKSHPRFARVFNFKSIKTL